MYRIAKEEHGNLILHLYRGLYTVFCFINNVKLGKPKFSYQNFQKLENEIFTHEVKRITQVM